MKKFFKTYLQFEKAYGENGEEIKLGSREKQSKIELVWCEENDVCPEMISKFLNGSGYFELDHFVLEGNKFVLSGKDNYVEENIVPNFVEGKIIYRELNKNLGTKQYM